VYEHIDASISFGLGNGNETLNYESDYDDKHGHEDRYNKSSLINDSQVVAGQWVQCGVVVLEIGWVTEDEHVNQCAQQ
jgi:hypothetical protein